MQTIEGLVFIDVPILKTVAGWPRVELPTA